MISIDRNDLRVLLDTAVNSLDFGSGFLDNPEVEVLRRVAVLLGIDSKDVTPENFKASYAHPFTDPLEQLSYDWSIKDPYAREKTK